MGDCNATPKPYAQVYANYDKAFVDKVHSVQLITQDQTGNDVQYALPCVFATPDRAFGQIRRQIARKKKVKESDVQTIPLPIAALSRVNQDLDLTRFVQHRFSRLEYSHETNTYVGMNRPSPWDFTYQVDVWARTLVELDLITTQIILWLRADEFYLTVDHPRPMGERIVLTQFKGLGESNWQDTKDEKKRSLRRTFTFVVHGWIVPPAINAPVIYSVITDIYDDTNIAEVLLDQVVVSTDDVTADDDDPPVVE